MSEQQPQAHTETAPKKSNKKTALSWLKTVGGYVAMFFIVYTVINWWRQPVMPANPQLVLTDHHGQKVDIKALSEDKPVLVYFWGSWCHICRTTSPTINQLSQESQYPVVTIAVQSGDNTELENYLNKKHFTFTTINDADGQIFSDWQGQVTPSYVILEDGKMSQALTGIQPLWSLKLRLWLSEMF